MRLQKPPVTERSYVATRGGVEALMKQLYYEARARGLAQAQRVLVIADGAVWIWNLVEDRFSDAVQRLDLYHANTCLWAVANELHGTGTGESRQWVKPLLKQIRNDQDAKVIILPPVTRCQQHVFAGMPGGWRRRPTQSSWSSRRFVSKAATSATCPTATA
jgi:predicted membrane protein